MKASGSPSRWARPALSAAGGGSGQHFNRALTGQTCWGRCCKASRTCVIPLRAGLSVLQQRVLIAKAQVGKQTLFFFFFASASVVRRVWGTYVSRLLRQPAGVCSQAAREQLTQRHLSVVRWVAGPRDGQLEERAGVRPERCERGLGFPALVQGLASGRGAPRRPLASPCPCEQSQERQGAAADSPANFNAEDNQAAAPSLPQFRVSSVFAVDCLVEGEARLVVSPWAGLAIPSDWAHDCGVHRDLGALPYGESIGDNLYAPSVQGDFFFFRPFSLLPLASVAFTQAA